MKPLLIKQALVVPFAAMLVPIAIAFTIPGYSSFSQHISEAALLDHPIALVQRAAAIITGMSILLFGLGLLRLPRGRMEFTPLIAAITGISLASNGMFVMGSPLHGLFGIGGFSLMLVPAFFAAELARHPRTVALRRLSLLVAFVSASYIWSMWVHVEPAQYRGLIQRVFTVMYFGWYSVASFWLLYGCDGPALRSGRAGQASRRHVDTRGNPAARRGA